MYKRILFPVDISEESSWRTAAPVVVGLCQAFGAELHLLTIIPDLPVGAYRLHLPEDTEDLLAHAAAAGLDEFAATHIPGDIVLSKHFARGPVYQAVLQTAGTIDADLIAMASHRPEMADYLIGPNAARVVRHAQRSVLVIR
ncbi:MAG: universal stress protein [Rhodospirillales bacterium]|nr:universal stress protein [Rhodospirillales bacterium]